MLVDFHTHIDQYSESELVRAIDIIAGHRILTVAASCDFDSFEKNIEIARKPEVRNLIIPAFGVHPSYCDFLPDSEGEIASVLEPYLQKSDIIAEIGLDFFWEKKIPHKKQEKIFLSCLDHANRYKKVAVIHTKGAEKQIADILKEFPDVKPVIHWYDGSEEIFKTYLDRGYYETFGCEVRYSSHIQKLLSITPDELLLSETDNPTGEPWLCGMHKIPQTDNSPLLIKRVICDIAEVKKISHEECEKLIETNTRKILRFKSF
ncbi:MAG: TatD family hydrolase [Treponema sp.]|nr:TatD family hydrolase [Treponema sp.]